MYRFCLKPKWILSHILVLLLIVVMINLAFWQLRRLDQRREFNATVRSRSKEPVVAVDDVLPASASFADADAVVFRKVTADGTYVPDEQVIVRGRTFQGQAGSWLVTPLRLDDGTAVAVNRGWVPLQEGTDVAPSWAPPTGTVHVEGLLVGTQTRSRLGATDPEGRHLDTMARADVARLQEQVDEDLIPAVLQLDEQRPAQPGDFPYPVEPPELTEGPHLNYAGQWFIFSTIAIVGYPLILRRVARTKAAEAAAEAKAAGGGDDGSGDTGAPIDEPAPVDTPA